MFLKKLVGGVMQQRLPPFARPACTKDGCEGRLAEPRPFHTEPQGAPGVLTVHCLSKCEVCGAEHKGTRTVGVGKKLRAIDQEFHQYNDEDRELVRSVLPKYTNNQSKLAEIQAMPVRD